MTVRLIQKCNFHREYLNLDTSAYLIEERWHQRADISMSCTTIETLKFFVYDVYDANVFVESEFKWCQQIWQIIYILSNCMFSIWKLTSSISCVLVFCVSSLFNGSDPNCILVLRLFSVLLFHFCLQTAHANCENTFPMRSDVWNHFSLLFQDPVCSFG